MKRRRFGLFVVLCTACTVGCPAWAQTADPPAPVSSPASDAQIATAKKEVKAYNAAYRKMEREKGTEAALRYFLAPEYKQRDASGKARSREEWITILAKAAARLKTQPGTAKNAADTSAPTDDTEEAPSAATAETYRISGDTIILIQNINAVANVPDPPSKSKNDAPPATHQWHIVQIDRKIYQRTPNGLRLKEETVVSEKIYIDGKFHSQQPVPRVGL